jgi:hypothetical protein
VRLVSLASAIVLSGCSVFGIRTEPMPPYTVLAQLGNYEVRRYGPRLVAETTVDAPTLQAREIGFRRLAHYIFGGNQGSKTIAMTAPVAQLPGTARAGTTLAMTAPVSQQGSTIRFFMPPGYTMATLPAPEDPKIRLAEVPEETVAILRFSGSIAPAAVEMESRRLRTLLKTGPWHPAGEGFAWFYDPPWTLPWLRRNEVGVPVARGA